MPLLEALINQYGNSAANPYARPGAPSAPTADVSGLLDLLRANTPVSGLIDQLGRGSAANPYRAAASNDAEKLSSPTIVQIGPDEAARAQAQQGGALVGVGPNPMQQPAPLTAAAASQVAQSANPPVADALLERRLAGAPMQLQSVTVPDMPVTPVMADDGSTAQDATPAESAPAAGGLLGMLSGAAQDAVQSPAKSKGLLERLGASISNMSPAASQALIASGLTMLAGNDGSRNLGQLIGLGGIAGLNAYSNVKQTDAANQLATRKLDQQQQQQQFDNGLAARKQLWEEGKPISVGADQSLYARNPDGSYKPVVQAQPSVARTADVIGPDGRTYTVQLDRSGNQIGAPLLKSDPFSGPLSESQQKSVNDAQNAALTAQQTYQKTNALLNQLANAPEFSAGLGATFNDWLAKATGNPYEGQQLRNQLKQFVNSTILNELPPGSASDKDVQLVRNGTPSDTADKKTWKAYISAVANVQQAAAVAAQIRADYLTANRGSLGPLMQPATIRGRQFPAGASLDEVLKGGTQNSASPSRSALIAAAQAELARRRGGQ
ncbi:hypothetical protein [Burkholderia multivorans]|uniref:hypothetical protein n=1 Tax=Burkholderia multivorans TaxID=87883 RepID=UPI0018DBC8F4|nr:hypothetical protein [Burkholderia multivorans]MBH9661995.1 hypothetical protein [Burkholderia multivorans]